MSVGGVKQLHVLVFGSSESGNDFVERMSDCGRVEHVATFEEALEALCAEPFDLVVTQAEGLLPLPDADHVEHDTGTIDGGDQGIGIISGRGQLQWANPKMLSFADDVRVRVCDCCMNTIAGAQADTHAEITQLRARRFNFTSEDNERFELTATPVIDLHNCVTEVVAVVSDARDAKCVHDRTDEIDRAGRELLSIDAEQFARMDVQDRLSLLEQRILRCTSELLHFDNFGIRVLNRKTNQLELVLSGGLPADSADCRLDASAEASGIRADVASRGRSYICPDIASDPRYDPDMPDARSSLTVPLVLHDRVVGVANFESRKPAAFDEDDRRFAEVFGRYVAIALNILELLVTERHATTGRLGSDVMAEITGPLNDILTDVENLVEDYIGHDDLRHRLRMLSENLVKIRESIREVTSMTPGLIGARSNRHRRKDALLGGKRVLVADDEDVIRETVTDVLTGYGCVVASASDGDSAVGLLGSQPFDLVLSDIKMPGKTGYDVFAAAKEINANTPVILTTGFGYDPNHAIVRARREGLAAVLFKPFKVDQLLGEVRRALSSARG
ncbi:MAG: response regulator [Phycisphaerae bacterium]